MSLAAHVRAVCGLVTALALAAAATLATDAAAAEVLRDDRGVSQRFDAPPRRIVSLLPSLTESICALDACGLLVGTDRYSNHPAAVRGLPKLGGLDDTAVEAVVALRPDVVLSARSARVNERLEALGLKVLALESQSHADVQRTLVLLARLLGRADAGPRLWQGIEQTLAAAAARVPPRLRGTTVYFEVGAPYAAGPDSFIGSTLQRLGLGNALPAALGPFPALNPEFVVLAQPALVMAARADLAAMPARPGWATLPALRNGQRCGFDAPTYELLIRPGPRLGEAAQRMADCLVALPPVPLPLP